MVDPYVAAMTTRGVDPRRPPHGHAGPVSGYQTARHLQPHLQHSRGSPDPASDLIPVRISYIPKFRPSLASDCPWMSLLSTLCHCPPDSFALVPDFTCAKPYHEVLLHVLRFCALVGEHNGSSRFDVFAPGLRCEFACAKPDLVVFHSAQGD